MFQQDDFDSFVLNNKVIGFYDTPIKLVSGRLSHWYVNWRRISNDVFLAEQLAHFVLDFVEDLVKSERLPATPDCFYGVPEGASKTAILTQYLWAKRSPAFGPGTHRLAMGRGHAKTHGAPEDKFFVGSPAGKTVILEDVSSTGQSVIGTLETLKEARTPVIAAIGFTDRMEIRHDGRTAPQAIADFDLNGTSVPYYALSSADRLLPKALEQFSPPPALREKLQQELRKTHRDAICTLHGSPPRQS